MRGIDENIIKIKVKKKIKKAFKNFMQEKKNFVLGIAVVFIPLIYESLGIIELEKNMIPYTLSPLLTRELQSFLGTDGVIAYFSSYYYFLVQLLILGSLGTVIFFSKKPWVYFMAVLICFGIDSLFYFFFPLAPPVRTGEAVPVRLILFPISDHVITAKYSAFPSGHIMSTFMGFLICRKEGFRKMEILFLTNTVIMSFIIVYLGEHYLIDSFGGILLAVSGFKVAHWIEEYTSGYEQ